MLNQISQIIQTQHTEILRALGEHVEISLISLLIAAFIAVPLAILLMNHQRTAEVVLQITSIFQTIPSLALLGILIPFVGIGTVPAIITLVIYAIMPIFQNTYAGLTTIDPELEEAATAFGLSRWHKLQRLELPLAMPMIISGFRISTVMIIGTATLAALIGAGGLGTYIILGIESNNNALLLIGAVLSAALALIFSGLIKLLSQIKLSAKKIGYGVAIIIAFFGGFKIYQQLQSPQTEITIAGKLGSEPEILINMYRDLIQQDNPQIKVKLKTNFGGTSFLFKALQSEQIDLYPEFTGTVLQSLVKTKGKTAHNPEITYQTAKSKLNSQFKLTYLKPMAYQNGYDLAVSADFAKKYNLKTISDLTRVGSKVHAAFDPDFYHQDDGYPGLKKAYGLEFAEINTMEPSIRYKAIANHKVNVVDGYTTDAEVQKYQLVVLKDDLAFFPPYQGAPLMSQAFAKKNPRVVKSLNKLAGKISATEMQKMNYQVTFNHKKAATVAQEFLIKQGLLTK